MANTIILNEKQLITIKNGMLNEFMVDPKSKVSRDGFSYFILMRGDLLFFNWDNVETLDAFIERHKDELGIYVRRYYNRKDVFGADDFDDLVEYLGHYVPYLITGTILRGNEVHINNNEVYDIMSSNELYQLVKKLPNTDIFVSGKKIDKETILGNKGKAMPKVWYHGTTYGDALGILRKGLRPKPEKSVYKIKHDKTIFLTSDIKQAASYSQTSSSRKEWSRENYPCVLEIDASKLDETKMVYDYDIHFSHTDGKDKVYNQRMTDLDLSYDKETSAIQGDKDPRKFKKVGYRGIVLPDAITGVYTVGGGVDITGKMSVDVFIDYAAKFIYYLDEEDKRINEVAPDVDEYTIGDEGSNPPAGGNFYHVDENIEYEVDSSEVDLSTFKKKDELAPKLWSDGELDSRIRLKLLDIADDFWKFVNLTWVKPKGIILTGSICNFNWSDKSDIDLHLIADFDEIDEKTEFVKAYLDSKKNEWNDKHEDLRIYGFPVELYVQNVGEMPESGGIYDLEENDWIKEPSEDGIEDVVGSKGDKVRDKAAKIMTIIDDMYNALYDTDDPHQVEMIGDDASYLWKKVKAMRKDSLEKSGENGVGNIVYKVLRRTGYLDKLFDLSNIVYDRVNSITEGKELIKEYLDKEHMFPLYKLLNLTDKEKVLKIASENQRFFEEFAEKKLCKFPYKKMGIDANSFKQLGIEKAVDLLDRYGLCEFFIEEIIRNSAFLECLPPYITMKFQRFFKNQWCIHFTRDAEKVAKEGFKRGHSDINTLSYTRENIYGNKPKDDKGYNYCFLMDSEDARNDFDISHFGLKEAVIFIANGVEVYHYGDHQKQAIFWGPSVKEIIPIKSINNYWYIMGKNGRIFRYAYESPSKVAEWVTNNYQQYRKQISYERHNTEEGIAKYKDTIMLLKEEVVADGNASHNPYKKRWDAERKALKDFICNFGKLMTSKENGKTYKVYYDKTLSELVGYNYCICLQWDQIELKPKSILYIRALDKFTDRIFQPSFDDRGMDNVRGTSDNNNYGNY